jgi:hypothetical protein
MLQPRCECASAETRITFEPIGASPHAAFSMPMVSTQSSDSTTSASFSTFLLASSGNVAGGAACSGWSVGNAAGVLMSVNTRALQLFGERDARFPAGFAAAHAPGENDRVLCRGEHLRRLLNHVFGRNDRRRSAESSHVG